MFERVILAVLNLFLETAWEIGKSIFYFAVFLGVAGGAIAVVTGWVLAWTNLGPHADWPFITRMALLAVIGGAVCYGSFYAGMFSKVHLPRSLRVVAE